MHGITVHPRALDHESLYKGCEGEIPHFFMVFLSLSLFSSSQRKMLSSLSENSFFFSDGEWGGRRWRRRRCKPLLFIFFLLLSTRFSCLYPILHSKFPNPNPIFLDLEKNKTKEKDTTSVLFGRSGVGGDGRCPWFVGRSLCAGQIRRRRCWVRWLTLAPSSFESAEFVVFMCDVLCGCFVELVIVGVSLCDWFLAVLQVLLCNFSVP